MQSQGPTPSAAVPATGTPTLMGTFYEDGRLAGNKLVPFPGPDHQAQPAAVPMSQYKPRRGPAVGETQLGVSGFSELLANFPVLPDTEWFPGQDPASLGKVKAVQEVIDELGVEEFCKLFVDGLARDRSGCTIDPNEFFAVAELLGGDNLAQVKAMQDKFFEAQKAMFLQFYREYLAHMDTKVIARTIGTALGKDIPTSVMAPIFEKAVAVLVKKQETK